MRLSKYLLLVVCVVGLWSDIALGIPNSFRVTNRSSEPYTGVVDVTLPIPPGEVSSVAELQNILADGQPTAIRVIKYHREAGVTSIAAVRLTTRLSLAPNEDRTVTLQVGSNNPPAFSLGSAIAAIGPDIASRIIIGARMGSQPECYTTLMGPVEILDANNVNFTVRWRVRPHCSSGTLPLSATVYMRLGSGDNHARFTLLLGNDTLERAVSGGINADVSLYVADPLQVAFHEPQAYGGAPLAGTLLGYRRYRLLQQTETIADGVRVPFYFNVGVGPEGSSQVRSARAAAANPANQILGLASYQAYRAGEVLGLNGVIPAPRFATVGEGRAALESTCGPAAGAAATGYKGVICQHPYFTGDQGDFGASAPVFAQQIVHTGSLCPLRHAFVGVSGEWLRPSASSYWSMQNGQERPVTLARQPNLMLWNDAVHQVGFYNSAEHQHYIARIPTASNSFSSGSSNYSRWDEEHDSFNSQAAVALLVGSEDLLDMLRIHVRTLWWNHYNWYRRPAMTAPRAIGRAGQSVMLLSSFFDDAESNQVLQAFGAKIRDVVRPFVSQQRSQVGFAHTGAGPVNATGIYTECLAGAYPQVGAPSQANCATVYGWQHGFLIQSVALLMRSGVEASSATAVVSDLLTDYDYYFGAGGSPVTLFLRNAPDVRAFGGIGSTWWAGYAVAAALMPNHPRSAQLLAEYVQAVLAPLVEGAPRVNQHWSADDRWNTFEDIVNGLFDSPNFVDLPGSPPGGTLRVPEPSKRELRRLRAEQRRLKREAKRLEREAKKAARKSLKRNRLQQSGRSGR